MKIIPLHNYRILKDRKGQTQAYRYRLMQMQKPELLQELLNYHDAYQKNPNDVDLTLRGQQLMEVLEGRAELTELQELSREFQRKLQIRLNRQLAASQKK